MNGIFFVDFRLYCLITVAVGLLLLRLRNLIRKSRRRTWYRSATFFNNPDKSQSGTRVSLKIPPEPAILLRANDEDAAATATVSFLAINNLDS